MKSIRILHITDLHIHDPLDTKENLRKLFYKEYLNLLVKKIKESIKDDIDYLIATGDFVNKANFKNFQHRI